jgi:hypothetical protein
MPREIQEFVAKLTTDNTDALRGVQAVDKAASQLVAKPYDIDLRISDDADADLARVKQQATETAERIEQLGQDTVTIRIDADQLEQVQKALGETKADVEQLDAETVDITVKADQLDSVNKSLTDTKSHVQEVGKSAESSKSALANMVGNSAQDLGQVAGVAGSAGVAVGQMAEYFTDATLAGEGFGAALGSFATVAIPIAALAIAVPILTAAWQDLSGQQDAAAESAKKLKAAQDALATGAADQGVRKLVDDNKDLFDAAEKAGVPVQDLVNFIRGASDTFTGAGQSIETTSGFISDLRPNLDNARKGWALNNEETATAKDRYQQVADALGLVTDGQGKFITNSEAVDAANKAQAEQAANLVDALTRQHKAVLDLADAQAKLAHGWNESAMSAESFTSVFTGQTDQLFRAHQAYADVADGVAGLSKAVKDAGSDFLQTGGHLTTFTDDGRKVLDSVQQLAGAIGSSLSAELQNAGGNYDAVRTKAADYRDELTRQLAALGVNSDEIQNYVQFLNLTPDEVETTIRLSQADEARKKIQDLNVDIANLPATSKTEFLAAYDKGDFVSAYNVLLNTLTNNGQGITTDAHADMTSATNTVGQWRVDESGKVVYVPVNADTKPAMATIGLLNGQRVTVIADVEQGRVSGSLLPRMAGGPATSSGWYRVGEAGPETVYLPQGAQVRSAGQTMTADASAQAAHITYNVSVFVQPVGAPGPEVGRYVVDAIDAFERRSGSRRRVA